MKSIFKTFIHQSLWTHYLTLFIIIIGVTSLFNLRREARPPVNFDRLSISIPYRGASAEDVEQLVLSPIEEKLDEIDGIQEYRSTAFEGLGSVTVKLDPDYSKKDDVVDDVQRAIDQITEFPEIVDDPVVKEVKAKNIPVISIALYGQEEDLILRNKADWLKGRLKRIPGVSRVDMEGFKDLHLKIETDPHTLSKYRISIGEIMSILKGWNIDSPGGSIQNKESDISIRVQEKLRRPSDLVNLPLRANDAGRVLELGDIAQVRWGLEDEKVNYLYNKHPAVILTVVKKENADTITVVDRVKNELEELSKVLPPNIQTATFRDDSQNIKAKLGIVQNNVVIGLVFVAIILFLTLSFRVAVITVIGLPVAFLGGLAIIWLYGFTINTLVVLGIIVVLGMLVDDAIVVSENIHYYVEKGEEPHEAALKGVHEVWSAVTATVLTTMIAFLPLAFMKEIIGKFIRVMPIVVICMLIFSLIESLLILPTHAAEILRPSRRRSFLGLHIETLKRKYSQYVSWSLNHKKMIFLCLFIFSIPTGFLGKRALSNFVLFPKVGISGLNIKLEAKSNTSLEKSQTIALELAKLLDPMVGEDIESLKITVGQATVGGTFGTRERGSHLSLTEIKFPDDAGFIKREKLVMQKIREKAQELKQRYDVKFNIAVSRTGPPIGRPIQVEISSRDFEKTQNVARQLEDIIAKLPGTQDVASDLQANQKKYRLKIDKQRAIELGLNLQNIANTVYTAFDGLAASTTREGTEEVFLVVTFPKSVRSDLSNLLELPVLSKNQRLIPLKSIAEVEEAYGKSVINRLNGQRTITIFGDVDNKQLTSKQANFLLKPEVEKLGKAFPEVKIELGGEEKDRIKAVKDTVKQFLLAIIGIFMIISLSFNSILFPFFVILAIPFGLSGVVWALFLHNAPLTMMGIIGVVGLSGVVVNNAIILVQFILVEIRAGASPKDAISIGAQRRLRPIIITTFTTLAGLFPAIYGVGGEDTLVQPLALTLGWGLFFATVLILLVLPALIYSMSKVIKLK